MNERQTGLNIKAVSERTGVPLHTLRAWERRYGVPRPARVPGNKYRVYDEQDLADVLWMKRQVEAGVSPAQASAMLRQQGTRTPIPQPTEADQPIVQTRNALLADLLSSDEAGAQHLLDEAWALYSPEQVAQHLIQPVMTEIGRRWMNNEITVGQEHFASNLIRQRLIAVLQAQPALPLSAPRMIAACPPAEQHELGLLLFSLLARRHGWQVFYLGQRTPLADLVRWAEMAHTIVLTVATANGLASLIPLWRESNRPRASLVFGGTLLNQVPVLREHMPGSFLGDDAVSAIHALATRELSGPSWQPERLALDTAETCMEQRLRLAETTIARESGAREADLGIARSALVDPTLFLIDALAGSLAFGAPEIMEEQGVWIRTLLVAHGIDPKGLEHHLAAFARACSQVLTDKQVRLVEPLVGRLLHPQGTG